MLTEDKMRERLFGIVLVVTSVAGCSPEPIVTTPASPPAAATPPMADGQIVPPAATPASHSSDSAERLKRKAAEAWAAAEDLTAESRDQFVAEAKRRLALMDAQLEEWKRKTPALSQEAKTKWDAERIELQQRRDELQRQLDQLGTAGAGAWGDMKVGAAKAWKEKRVDEKVQRKPGVRLRKKEIRKKVKQ